MLSIMRSSVVSLLLLAVSSAGLTVREGPKSKSFDVHSFRAMIDKSPGTMPIPHWSERWEKSIYKTHHPEREAWGERLLAAAKPAAGVGEGKCGALMHFSGYTWCEKAMPKEVTWEKRELYGGPVLAASASRKQARAVGTSFMGISYGIRERDIWSEVLSMRYLMPTQLKDCFIRTTEGPMGPDDLRVQFPPPAECGKTESGKKYGAAPRICYGAKYYPEKTCLNDADAEFPGRDGNLTFESLKTALRHSKPVSAFLKIDIEGAEWDVLEQLVNSPELISKIRVLDMEAHINKYIHGGHAHDPMEAVERKVTIMERLAEKFAVVGSDISFLHPTLEQDVIGKRKKDESYQMSEPVVYAKNGYSLSQYMVSFVNKDLL